MNGNMTNDDKTTSGDNTTNGDGIIEVCSSYAIHPEVIDKAKNEIQNDGKLIDMAELFKVFSDPTRLKIINALISNELCVCDLSFMLGMNQSAVSHQLKTLKQAKLVKYRREGKMVYYTLDDEHVKEIFSVGLTHLNEM